MSTDNLMELGSVPTQQQMEQNMQQQMHDRTIAIESKFTFYDLLIEAAKAQCGQSIAVRQSNNVTNALLKEFCDSIVVRVLQREEKPLPAGRTIVDISTKEVKNYGEESTKDPSAKDISKTTVGKASAGMIGRNYQFIGTQGLSWEADENIGLKILVSGMTGGSIGLCRDTSEIQSLGNSLGNALGYEFNQEESICVPPGKKVLVTLTTYAVLYQLRYKLEFKVPNYRSILVFYNKPFCCGLVTRSSSTSIPYQRIICNLPNYREDGTHAYFTQEGFLSWIGEFCDVDKREAVL